MKKSNLVKAFAVMAIMAAGAFFVGCADPVGGNNAGGSTDGSGTFGTKAPDVAKAVGDIVFNDGSATPYTAELTLSDEQKAAAIAVIFKVDGGKTLGVGLKHSSLAWCTADAKAYNENIETIQCPATGDAGNLTFTVDTDGSDNLEQIASFLTEKGLTDDTTGTDADKRYPAFYFAKNYKNTATNLGAAYENSWYLPTVAELFDIWKVKATVDAASSLCGGSQFGNSYYRSSSQDASHDNGAYFLCFGSGYWEANLKNTSFGYDGYVCAVRAFN
ncbi:MAG: hypothetical protein MJ181_09070 [Treponema sp.]|nr:hypothetical protein [Treponema sp.]